MSQYTLLALLGVLCFQVVLAGKMDGHGGMMGMMKKKMGGGGGGPSLTWNINVGGGGGGVNKKMANMKMMKMAGMMSMMMIGMTEMSKPWCRDRCFADGGDCPNGAQEDMTDRGDLCRTCMLECMTCKQEGMATKMKSKMAKKHKMMREGKMMMPDMMGMDMEKMMAMDMQKKGEDGKSAFQQALDTMKEDQMSLMNILGMNCDKFWPNEEEEKTMGMQFMQFMKKKMSMKMDGDYPMSEPEPEGEMMHH